MGYYTYLTIDCEVLHKERFEELMKQWEKEYKKDTNDLVKYWMHNFVVEDGMLEHENEEIKGFYDTEYFCQKVALLLKGNIHWDGEESDDMGYVEFDGKGNYRIRYGEIVYEDSKWINAIEEAI